MIHMHFKPGGKVEIAAEGYGGQLCRKATEKYLQAFGGKVVSDDETPEAQLPAVIGEDEKEQEKA